MSDTFLLRTKKCKLVTIISNFVLFSTLIYRRACLLYHLLEPYVLLLLLYSLYNFFVTINCLQTFQAKKQLELQKVSI